MHPSTHLLLGWLTAEAGGLDTRRDRALVAVAGIIPDVDGVGMIAEVATRGTDHPLLWWSNYHHLLAHNALFGIAYTAASLAIATKRWRTSLLVLLSFHLHLLGDIVGARGPDGDQWPIPYLWPFSDTWQLAWKGQWALNAWPNMLLTAIALGAMFYLAWDRGRSPLELVSRRLDAGLVGTLRRRFPRRCPVAKDE